MSTEPKPSQTKTEETPPSPTDTTPESLTPVDFKAIEARIFTVRGKDLLIGGEPVSKELRATLREDARYIERSRVWELFEASIFNEAANLALIQSSKWEHVEFAKALHHWGHFFRKTLFTLSED